MNKNEILESTLEMISVVLDASTIKMKRNKYDYFADKLRQAASMNTLTDMFEKLCGLLECSISLLKYDNNIFLRFCKNAKEPEAISILNWIRKNAILAVMTCNQRRIWDDTANEGKGGYVSNHEEFFEIISSFEIPDVKNIGHVKAMKGFDINVKATCLSPLAHGSDVKMGNATGFRTYKVLSENDSVLELPAYSGNALRGILRDFLADHLLRSLGITPNKTKPPVNLWFFHVLYEGGTLKGVDASTKKVTDKLGKNGKADIKGLHEFRDMLPIVSLLGTAVGNRMLEGRVNINNLRPVCYEWGFDTDVKVDSLLTWEFLIRKNDNEDYDEHSGMIANTEVLKTGSVLRGGIDISSHASDLEKSALITGLELIKNNGYLGAQNARGMGRVELEYALKTLSIVITSQLYTDYLKENKNKILAYMESIGAIELLLGEVVS